MRIDTTLLPDLTPEEIKEALARPRDFGYSGGNRDMFKSWALGPITRTRDSGLIDRSNHDALMNALGKHPEWSEDWAVSGAGHWAVGWVDHLSYRVLDAQGNVTAIARFLKEWFRALREEYVLADEDLHTMMSYDQTVANIRTVGERMTSDKAPENWPYEAYGWFSEHAEGEIEDTDDQGGYPSDDAMRACLAALGWLDTEE